MAISQAGEYRELYAISTWQYVNTSLEAALQSIAARGFRWVELWADQAHLDPRLSPDVSAVRALLGKLGLSVHSVHTPFNGLDIGLPDRRRKQEWLRVIGASLEATAALGAEVAVVHVSSHGANLADPLELADSRAVTLDFCLELAQLAGRLGVRLALENLPCSAAQMHLGGSLQELAALFPNPEIGFCLDTGHASINGFDMRAEIEATRGRMLSIHAHNNDGIQDHHWLPSRGVIDWPAVKQDLARAGYRGLYVLEINGNGAPDDVLDQLVEFARRDVMDGVLS